MNLLFYELIDLGLTEDEAHKVINDYGSDEDRIQTNIDYALGERAIGKAEKNFTGFLMAAIRNNYAKNGNSKWRSSGDWEKKSPES